LYLQDISDAIEKIEQYTAYSFFSFLANNDMRYDAVLRNLQIIGEAAKNIPPDLKKRYPLEWPKIIGLRDILSHAYFGIDEKIIWDIVKNKLPELKRTIVEMLNEYPQQKETSFFKGKMGNMIMLLVHLYFPAIAVV